MTLTAAPKVPPDDLVVVGGAVRSLLPPSLGPEVAARSRPCGPWVPSVVVGDRGDALLPR